MILQSFHSNVKYVYLTFASTEVLTGLEFTESSLKSNLNCESIKE